MVSMDLLCTSLSSPPAIVNAGTSGAFVVTADPALTGSCPLRVSIPKGLTLGGTQSVDAVDHIPVMKQAEHRHCQHTPAPLYPFLYPAYNLPPLAYSSGSRSLQRGKSEITTSKLNTSNTKHHLHFGKSEASKRKSNAEVKEASHDMRRMYSSIFT